MHRISLILLLFSLVVIAEPLRLMVSIPPQLESVRAIAGTDAIVESLVPSGASPENYSPTAKDMIRIAEAQMLFTVGAPIEKALIPKIKRSYPKLVIVDATTGMSFLKMEHRHSHGHDNDDEKEHGDSQDPHVWLSMQNMKIHSSNVASALQKAFPNKADFKTNLAKYNAQLDVLSSEIDAMLSPMKGKSILVFHPAFAYFLQPYGIDQLPVEADGQQPTPKHLAHIAKIASTLETKVLFIQPQTNPAGAKAVAKDLKFTLKTIDPLPADYSAGMRKLATAISSKQ